MEVLTQKLIKMTSRGIEEQGRKTEIETRFLNIPCIIYEIFSHNYTKINQWLIWKPNEINQLGILYYI